MSHASNKVKWCLTKAEKELKEGRKHRGLIITEPDKDKALKHLHKAQHYLKATIKLYETGFSDISASTVFYVVYHALLAILAKHGIESRNQECTFAYALYLIESRRITLSAEIVEELQLMQKTQEEKEEETIVDLREDFQYGTKLSMEYPQYTQAVNLAKKILEEAKEELEK